MGNMDIYNAHRQVPKEATKPITAGRLKGMTDINPMWRIKVLTEQFGPCGIGWYYTTDKQWFEPCGQETVAFVNISLYVKVDGEWSKPISGTGGSKLGAMEKSGLYVSDEALKMATTDAISVACKQLGFAADVYWQNDRSKYSGAQESAKEEKGKAAPKKESSQEEPDTISEEKFNHVQEELKRQNISPQLQRKLKDNFNIQSFIMMTDRQYDSLMDWLRKREEVAKNRSMEGAA